MFPCPDPVPPFLPSHAIDSQYVPVQEWEDSETPGQRDPIDLKDYIDDKQVTGLNITPSTQSHLLTLFYSETKQVISSDVDSQLLLYVPFKETVQIQGIKMSADTKKGPCQVSLFINKFVDFNDIDNEMVKPNSDLVFFDTEFASMP